MTMTAPESELAAQMRAFVDESVAPFAGAWDAAQAMPREVIDALAARGLLGANVLTEHGGRGHSMVEYGLIHEALGRGCSSLRSLLTVHGMVAHVLVRWGTPAQKAELLPALVSGDRLAAFCLTEPDVGSDAAGITATAEPLADGWRLSGIKRWITFGQVADLFLVFARVGPNPIALLVERDRPGIEVVPIYGMLGLRASMLAEIRFSGCEVPRSAALLGEGFGISAVASTALDLGRYTVAWGCVGIAAASLSAAGEYASRRQQFGRPIGEHQLVRRRLTEMVVGEKTARALCISAGRKRDAGDPSASLETWAAKYHAAEVAMEAATHAVQLHGALGCSDGAPVERYFRDAKIMELIEGSTEIQQNTIAEIWLRTRASVARED